jgi:hypothetical protein
MNILLSNRSVKVGETKTYYTSHLIGYCQSRIKDFFVFLMEVKNNTMPTIAMFFGIIIRMYYAPKEHNPPHIHTYYQNHRATYLIDDGNLQNGKLPSKQQRMVQAWIEIHKDELIANWELCQNGEKPFSIEPLK